eukprot:6967429-Prymnesium_polylepis.1
MGGRMDQHRATGHVPSLGSLEIAERGRSGAGQATEWASKKRAARSGSGRATSRSEGTRRTA